MKSGLAPWLLVTGWKPRISRHAGLRQGDCDPAKKAQGSLSPALFIACGRGAYDSIPAISAFTALANCTGESS